MDHDLEEVRVSRYHQGSDGLGAVVLIENPVLETRHAAIRLILIASPYLLPNPSQVWGLPEEHHTRIGI